MKIFRVIITFNLEKLWIGMLYIQSQEMKKVEEQLLKMGVETFVPKYP